MSGNKRFNEEDVGSEDKTKSVHTQMREAKEKAEQSGLMKETAEIDEIKRILEEAEKNQQR